MVDLGDDEDNEALVDLFPDVVSSTKRPFPVLAPRNSKFASLAPMERARMVAIEEMTFIL